MCRTAGGWRKKLPWPPRGRAQPSRTHTVRAQEGRGRTGRGGAKERVEVPLNASPRAKHTHCAAHIAIRDTTVGSLYLMRRAHAHARVRKYKCVRPVWAPDDYATTTPPPPTKSQCPANALARASAVSSTARPYRSIARRSAHALRRRHRAVWSN